MGLDERKRRIFHIEKYDSGVDHDGALKTLQSDSMAAVVGIAGACVGRDTKAQAAYAIHFDDGSPNNRSGLISNHHPHVRHTKQFAELYAASKAFDKVKELIAQFGKPITRVILYPDSKTLVRDLTNNIWDWAENGFRNKNGGWFADADALRMLHEKFQICQGRGVEVNFGFVRRRGTEILMRLLRQLWSHVSADLAV